MTGYTFSISGLENCSGGGGGGGSGRGGGGDGGGGGGGQSSGSGEGAGELEEELSPPPMMISRAFLSVIWLSPVARTARKGRDKIKKMVEGAIDERLMQALRIGLKRDYIYRECEQK